MQSNIDCVMDDINEFPDSWVELYNAGDDAINLSGYKIGKSSKQKKAWALPDIEIKSKGYVLVYCDKEASGLHTDFRLESGNGCNVFLFKDSEAIDSVTNLQKQPAPNVSYGRRYDGVDQWGYQLTSTPNKTNSGSVCGNDQVLGNVGFSHQGFVTTSGESFSLELQQPEGTPEGAVIKYTIDGSEPTLDRGLDYNEPIQISSTIVVKAKLFCEGWMSPRSVCHSYIFFPRELTLPVISIAINDEYLNDPQIGIYVTGSYTEGKENFRYNWRRPINLEYFEQADEHSIINQLCETRISGAGTRTLPLKSMTVYANKRFGKKNFNHEFFPDQKPGINDFKSLVFRNAGTDFHYLYMRDAVVQRSMAPFVDLDWQAWKPAIVYINGEYRGMLNIRERANENNIYSNYNGLEDVDVIENWNDLKEGDMENLNQFKAFYSEHGHTMSEYNNWMDCEEFINLMVMNLYFNNLDFPGNNSVMWRPRTEEGKWRWIAKDADFTLGLLNNPPDYNIFEWLYNPDYDEKRNWGANGSDSTRLFRRLMEDADFQREFVDKACIYVGDFLKESFVSLTWDSMYETIKYEYPYHRKLFAGWPVYTYILNEAKSWLSQRASFFIEQMGNFYHLGKPVPLQIVTSGGIKLQMSLNNVLLRDSIFDGWYFGNRFLSIKGEGINDYDIYGWQIESIYDNGQNATEIHEGLECCIMMPLCKKVIVSPIFGKISSAIERDLFNNITYNVQGDELIIYNTDRAKPIKLYTMTGKLVLSSDSIGEPINFKMRDRFYILRSGDNGIVVMRK